MEWRDQGIVLAARRHGEAAAIVSLLTREHGRHAGLVRGGQSRRHKPTVEPGSLVEACWRGRLEEHLGSYTLEPVAALGARLLMSPGPLAALSSACALMEAAVPEREPCQETFERFHSLLATLDTADWAGAYVAWEVSLLADLGFGLDLTRCAATGENDQLAYVSPKSGRAVSLAAGEPYRDRLLSLPQFLIGGPSPSAAELLDGLTLTRFFLERHFFEPMGRALPAPRDRLAGCLEREAGQGQEADAEGPAE